MGLRAALALAAAVAAGACGGSAASPSTVVALVAQDLRDDRNAEALLRLDELEARVGQGPPRFELAKLRLVALAGLDRLEELRLQAARLREDSGVPLDAALIGRIAARLFGHGRTLQDVEPLASLADPQQAPDLVTQLNGLRAGMVRDRQNASGLECPFLHHGCKFESLVCVYGSGVYSRYSHHNRAWCEANGIEYPETVSR